MIDLTPRSTFWEETDGDASIGGFALTLVLMTGGVRAFRQPPAVWNVRLSLRTRFRFVDEELSLGLVGAPLGSQDRRGLVPAALIVRSESLADAPFRRPLSPSQIPTP